RAPSPTSTAARGSAGRTWPRHWATARRCCCATEQAGTPVARCRHLATSRRCQTGSPTPSAAFFAPHQRNPAPPQTPLPTPPAQAAAETPSASARGGCNPPCSAQRIQLHGFHHLAAPAETADSERAFVDRVQPQRLVQAVLVDRAGHVGRQTGFGGCQV